MTRHTAWPYLFGFVLSLLLTFGAYFIALHPTFAHPIPYLATFAFVQAAIQMVLFLGLGKEKKPRWNLMLFFFMVSTALILILGSLWIMSNLHYNVMP
ncbi:MAG: cytochrome o ubiquinol/quinol oxidase subunit IV [Parachlamydiales bacterium]